MLATQLLLNAVIRSSFSGKARTPLATDGRETQNSTQKGERNSAQQLAHLKVIALLFNLVLFWFWSLSFFTFLFFSQSKIHLILQGLLAPEYFDLFEFYIRHRRSTTAFAYLYVPLIKTEVVRKFSSVENGISTDCALYVFSSPSCKLNVQFTPLRAPSDWQIKCSRLNPKQHLHTMNTLPEPFPCHFSTCHF